MEVNLEQFVSNLKDSEKRLDCLRFLRNHVIENSVSEELIEELVVLLEDSEELTRRLSWQVLFNSTVGNPQVAEKVVGKTKPFIAKRLEEEVPKTQNVICALLKQNLQQYSCDLPTLKLVLGIVKDDASHGDFALLLAFELVKNHNMVEQLDADFRLTVYELYQDALENGKLDQESLVFLIKQFKKSSQSLLTTFKDQNHLDPIEVSRIILILAQASSTDQFRSFIQEDMSLLIDCIYLLKMIHDAQKPVASMDQTGDPESPVYGLKCNLIRIIANMVYQHKINQDQVRDCSGVALILDCSPMDITNPIITQWVVFAIRNLCEDNPENQAIIAAIDKKGTMDKSALRDLGIDIHNE